ncbi:hypothetical protein AB4254_11265 [Vibrio breoganii]
MNTEALMERYGLEEEHIELIHQCLASSDYKTLCRKLKKLGLELTPRQIYAISKAIAAEYHDSTVEELNMTFSAARQRLRKEDIALSEDRRVEKQQQDLLSKLVEDCTLLERESKQDVD